MKESQPATVHSRLLIGFASASAVVYGFITWLSFQFQVHTLETNIPEPQRPLMIVLLLFALAFALYFAAVVIVRQSTLSKADGRALLPIVIGGAVLFRAVMWFSTPIQEVDVYRYMWDGVVSTQGVSPFRFPPQAIVLALDEPSPDPDLERLAALCRADPELAEVLRRVHFGQLPTVYPSVSQLVFAASAVTTPQRASVETRLGVIKFWLLLFDLGTLWLVIKLLMRCGMNPAMSVAYGWCPLVLKEIANSAHLDAIAIFLTTLAVFLLVKLLIREERSDDPQNFWWSNGLVVSATVLALAVGAKLYPVVLVPVIAVAAAVRFGWRSVLLPAFVFTALSLALLWPMLPGREPVLDDSMDASAGVMAFLRSWEMNDFLFMLVVENLKPPPAADAPSVWFSVLPDAMRGTIIDLTPYDTPFAATRFITSLVYVFTACYLVYRLASSMIAARFSAIHFCEMAFLSIAWFWLLSPTQNPWYWMWALPLLPFVRNATWYTMSCVVMVYYLRFWLEYHHTATNVFGSGYYGTAFFDFVVTWIEFLPWFVCLAISGWFFRNQRVGVDG